MNNDDLKYYFGTAEASITPSKCKHLSLVGYGRFEKCKGFHDTIYSRVNVISSSQKPKGDQIKLVMINLDLMGFGYRNTMELKDQMFSELGIKHNVVTCFSTHSHYSPGTEGLMPAPVWPDFLWRDRDEYLVQFIINQTIKAVKEAISKLVPAKIGYDKIQLRERYVHNRRPPTGYYEILHPYLNLIKFEDEQGKMIGLICTFPSHPVAVDREYNEISGGWPGYYVRYLKEMIKELNGVDLKVVPLILQGPSGNVTAGYPIKVSKEEREILGKERIQYMKSMGMGRLLAETAFKKAQKIKTENITEIKILSKDIMLPMTPIYHKLTKTQIMNILMAAVKRLILIPGLKIIRRTPELSFVKLQRFRPKGKIFKRLQIRTNVNTIKLNDIIMVTNPGEPFYEIGKEIKERTGYDKIFLAQLCNDCLGYNWTNINRLYNPALYDVEMTFSQFTGLLTRNTVIQQAKEIINGAKN